MSTGQRENLEAALRRSPTPVDSSVSDQRRLLQERASARPAPADVTVTPAELGGVPAADITIDGIEPRHVVLYFHGGVYVLGDAFQSADLASQIGRRAQARVISFDYRLAPEHPYPAAVDDASAPRQRSPRDHMVSATPRQRHTGQCSSAAPRLPSTPSWVRMIVPSG